MTLRKRSEISYNQASKCRGFTRHHAIINPIELKSLRMVQRYAHLAPDFQERAISTLDGPRHTIGTVPTNNNGEQQAKSLKGMVPPG